MRSIIIILLATCLLAEGSVNVTVDRQRINEGDSITLTITAKNVSGDASFFEVAINPVMYTARMEVADIFTQSYDFRSLDNTNPVDTTQITYS